MEDEMITGCELCGKTDEPLVWITRHYGVCPDCYDSMTPEEIDQIIEDWG